MPCRSKNRQIELTPTPSSPSSSRISSRVRSARSPISANSQAVCAFSGERLRPFCDLASALPVRLQRPTQAVAVDSPIPNRRPAPRAEKPPSTARITRTRRSLEYALAMPSPNSIYGPILAQSTTFGNPRASKFRIYAAGNRSRSSHVITTHLVDGEVDLRDRTARSDRKPKRMQATRRARHSQG